MKEKIDIKKMVTKEITSDYFFVEGQNLRYYVALAQEKISKI